MANLLGAVGSAINALPYGGSANRGGQFQTANELPVNVEQYQIGRKMLKTSIAPRAAREQLTSHVVNISELMFYQNGRPLKVSQQFRDHQDEHWARFMEDCMDEILTLGVVAVGYRVIKEVTTTNDCVQSNSFQIGTLK